MVRLSWFFCKYIQRTILELCGVAQNPVPYRYRSLDRPYVEYLCVRVLLPIGRLEGAVGKYLLEYLYPRKATWRACFLALGC